MESLTQISSLISRRLSFLAERRVSASIGSKYSVGTAVVFALNMTLGTGPLTLPFAFAQAGLLLGAGFLALCAVLGYITATYIIETLVLGNVAIFEAAEADLIARPLLDEEDSEEEEEEANAKAKSSTEWKLPSREEMRGKRPDKVFKIRERIELGEMGQRILPGHLHGLLYAFLFLYTFGTLCVYAVAVTSSVEALLPGGQRYHGAVVLCFGAIVFPLCFADMQKLRSLQSGIMVVRVVVIVTMLAAAGDEILHPTGAPPAGDEGGSGWVWRGMPMANPDGLPSLFANAVLSFMVHHSLPGLLAPLKVQAEAPAVISSAYGIAYVIYIVLGTTALAAFGSRVPPLYNLAFERLPVPVVPSLLCGYPVLLLAIYPIVGITLRNNLMNVLKMPPAGSRGRCHPMDVLATAAAALPPVAVAYVTQNVQIIVSYFAGYFGLSLLLLVPCLLVRWARRELHFGTEDFPLRSRWASTPVMALIVVLFALAISFNTYRLVFL